MFFRSSIVIIYCCLIRYWLDERKGNTFCLFIRFLSSWSLLLCPFFTLSTYVVRSLLFRYRKIFLWLPIQYPCHSSGRTDLILFPHLSVNRFYSVCLPYGPLPTPSRQSVTFRRLKKRRCPSTTILECLIR